MLEAAPDEEHGLAVMRVVALGGAVWWGHGMENMVVYLFFGRVMALQLGRVWGACF